MYLRFSSLLIFFFSFSSVNAEENKNLYFDTQAPYALIMDNETGIVLYSKNGDKAVPPSSMSKIATVLIGFNALKQGKVKPETLFTVSKNAWKKGGAASGSSSMFLNPNEKVSVMDLLRGIIIQSGNDASITLAEGLYGSEKSFADHLNGKAKEWGLETAHFMNASGLPAKGHIISAHDLAKIARKTITEYPEYYNIYSIKSMTWNGIKQYNRNPLLNRYKGADGLKTGHTSIAGYGLVASAKEKDKRRIIVLNGLKSEAERAREAKRIMMAAFHEFKVLELYKKNEEVYSLPIFMGNKKTIRTLTKKDINIGIHTQQRKNLKIYILYQTPVPAPIQKGEVIAHLVVESSGQILSSFPLVATEEVKLKKGIFNRAFSLITNYIRGEI